MEPTSSKIEAIISNIIPLLKFSEEKYWQGYFNYVLEKIKLESNRYETIKSLSMVFTGGMGSFSDLVLHKNGIPLIEENNALDELKDELYEACEAELRSEN